MEQFEYIRRLVTDVSSEEELKMLLTKKAKPTIALDIEPTVQHDPCHDLFRVYSLNLFKQLSKYFSLFILYRDMLATTKMDLASARKLAYDNISYLRHTGVEFTPLLESEIVSELIAKNPLRFSSYLYNTVLNMEHSFKNSPYDSASFALLLNLFSLLKIDLILCMDVEYDNYWATAKIFKKQDMSVPIALFRSLPDYKNKSHSPFDKERLFPHIEDTLIDIISAFRKYKTTRKTILAWLVALSTDNQMMEIEKKSKTQLYTFAAKRIAQSLKDYKLMLEPKKYEIYHKMDSEHMRIIIEALSVQQRVNILKLLSAESYSPSKLASKLSISLPTVLYHLKFLEKAKIIEREAKGKNNPYKLIANKISISL